MTNTLVDKNPLELVLDNAIEGLKSFKKELNSGNATDQQIEFLETLAEGDEEKMLFHAKSMVYKKCIPVMLNDFYSKVINLPIVN